MAFAFLGAALMPARRRAEMPPAGPVPAQQTLTALNFGEKSSLSVSCVLCGGGWELVCLLITQGLSARPSPGSFPFTVLISGRRCGYSVAQSAEEARPQGPGPAPFPSSRDAHALPRHRRQSRGASSSHWPWAREDRTSPWVGPPQPRVRRAHPSSFHSSPSGPGPPFLSRGPCNRSSEVG